MSDDPATQIRKALDSIIEHYDETIEPCRRGLGSHVKASKEPPIPISAHILSTRALCCSRMAAWCLLVIDERDLHTEHLSGLDVFAMADLLGRHAPWLGEHVAKRDVILELEASAKELEEIALDNKPRRFRVGLCPEHGTSEMGERIPCEGELKVILRNSDDLFPSEIRCSLDPDHRWTSSQWMFLGRRVSEELIA